MPYNFDAEHPLQPQPKIQYNRLSIMTAQEQKTYLEMCIVYATKQPSDPKEKQKFKVSL